MSFLYTLRKCRRSAIHDHKYQTLTKVISTTNEFLGRFKDSMPHRLSHSMTNNDKQNTDGSRRQAGRIYLDCIHQNKNIDKPLVTVSNNTKEYSTICIPPRTTSEMCKYRAYYRQHKNITSSLVTWNPEAQIEHNVQAKSAHLSQTFRPITSLAQYIPEVAKSWTVWGGSGFLIKTFHCNGLIPYWGCMSLTNITVRTGLLPFVVNGARTSARFAKVAPEVQFLVTIFQNDLRKLKEQKAAPSEQFALMRITFQSLRGLYKLHDVNPLQVLKSPLLQMPIFWYFSVDIRKLINGGNPELAQELTENGLLWVSDLTEPDPFYGFPILAGMLLYLNVEMAVGRKSLSGEASSKSNLARILKDCFQSLACFMPCFMSNSPAGVQIYLMTSFVFTLFQGMALRHDPIRLAIGLPATDAPMPESKFAKEFIELKELEKKAAEARGDGPVLGTGVLAPGFQTSFAGENRPSSIISNTIENESFHAVQVESFTPVENNIDGHFIPSCIRAPQIPPDFGENFPKKDEKEKIAETVDRVISQTEDDIMEAANQGKRPKAPIQILKVEKKEGDIQLNLKSLKKKKKIVKHARTRKGRRKP